MKYLRAVGFGVMLWVGIFVIISILMFTPGIKDHPIVLHIIYYVLFIPLVLLLAKWYFRGTMPTARQGFLLGLIGLAIGTLLDLAITVPFFIHSYRDFYTDVYLYIGYAEVLLLATLAGAEFDGPAAVMREESGDLPPGRV